VRRWLPRSWRIRCLLLAGLVLVMLLAGADSIRDVIAFPKTQRAACLMTEAPTPVDPAQLKELGLRLET